MLPIYFLVINKSNSSSPESQPSQPSQAKPSKAPLHSPLDAAPLPEPEPTSGPNDLGFVYYLTNVKEGIDESNEFMKLNEINKTVYAGAENIGTQSDNVSTHPITSIKRKWIYDKNNIYSIERTILNKNNAYSQEELSALGKTDKPNTYLVNQIVSTYDKNTILTSGLISHIIKPMILTIYSNYKK